MKIPTVVQIVQGMKGTNSSPGPISTLLQNMGVQF